jgi:hypothetical protein
LGLRRSHDRPLPATDTNAVLVVPTGARGPAFLLTSNFRAILGYNTALSYGLSVAHLSDRLRGEPSFARSWPRSDRMLTRVERQELQSLLSKRGLPLGTIDGKIGPKTRAAIRSYQASNGLLMDGYADTGLLERLRADH